MGNNFASYTCAGKHRSETSCGQSDIMKSGLEYFTSLYDCFAWRPPKSIPSRFCELRGGIAADFLICVVPSLKHDLKLSKVRD